MFSRKVRHQRNFQYKFMQKNVIPGQRPRPFRHAKILIAMKLTILLTLIGVVNVSASAYSQAGKVTLNMRNASIVEVLSHIEKVTDYHFIYSLYLVANKRDISIAADKEPLKKVLYALLVENGVSYKVLENNLIVVTPAPETAQLSPMGALFHAVPVSGKVTDDKGIPLTGVTVQVKSAPSIGTVTDEKGRFTLNVPSESDTLVFSYVGYISRDIAVNGKKTLKVQLTSSSKALKDVVIVGYGKQK
jgi:hypothetical protein